MIETSGCACVVVHTAVPCGAAFIGFVAGGAVDA